MSEKPDRKNLEKKIDELEKKLSKMSDQLSGKTDKERAHFVIASSPIGQNKLDTIKQVSEAKNKSEQRAGLIKLSDDGSVLEEDKPINIRIPHESIHKFNDLKFCECECHKREKKDCMYCYDHPTHLEAKREIRKSLPPTTSTINETIPQKPTKSRLRRLLGW